MNKYPRVLTCVSSTDKGSCPPGIRLARIVSPTSRLMRDRNDVRRCCEDVVVVISATTASRSTARVTDDDPEAGAVEDDG